MLLVTAGYHDDIDIFVRENLFVVSCRVSCTETNPVALAASAVARMNGSQVQACEVFYIRQMLPAGKIAGADQCHSQLTLAFRARRSNIDPAHWIVSGCWIIQLICRVF